MSSNADATKLPDLKNFPGTLSDRVYLALRNAILSLDFTPGQVIRKQAICDHLGISRSPVSDALRKLDDDGLVDVIPQSATRVSKISLAAIREESFLREALEVAAVERAAEVRSEQQLTRIARNMRMQEFFIEDLDFSEFYKYDQEFHELIMDCCGVRRLAPTVQLVSLQVHRARFLMLPEPGRSMETVREHEAIFTAIRDQDAEAAKAAMRTHIRQLLKRLEPLEDERPEMFIP